MWFGEIYRTTSNSSSILNPGKFIQGTNSSTYLYNWLSGNLKDLWNVGNTSIANNTATSQKTIYDPSPVGFKVPPPTAFTAIGLSTDYWNPTSGKEGIRVPNSGDFWRAFGYLAWGSGSSAYVGTRGYFWSCGPQEQDYMRSGWNLYFCSDEVYRQDASVRSWGYSVRPVSE